MLESIFAMDADDSADELGDEGLMPVRLGVDKVPVDLLIVNGDDLEVVEQLHAAHPEALLVLVGHPPGGQGVRWPVMRRPLDLHGAVSVLSELDWPDTPLERRVAVRQRPQATVQVSDGGQPSHQPPQLSQPSQPPSSRPPPTAFPSEDMSSAFAPTTARMPMPAAGPAAAQPGLSARAAWAMSERGAAEGPASSPAHRAPPSSVPMAASAPMPPLSVPPADTVLAAFGAGVRRLHVTGVTPALSASAAEATFAAVRHANTPKRSGCATRYVPCAANTTTLSSLITFARATCTRLHAMS